MLGIPALRAKLKNVLRRKRALRAAIESSGLFDPNFYGRHYPSREAKHRDLLGDFIAQGLAQRRAPHPLFDPHWYEKSHPEAVIRNGSAFVDYLRFGRARGYSPHPLFDSEWYLRMNPDVASKGYDPLRHYLDCGASEGRDPNLFFQTKWYLARYEDVRSGGLDPLAHFAEYGDLEGRSPGPLFDHGWYRQQTAAGEGGTLAHYLADGRFRGLVPHPYFDPAWYARHRPDVAAAGFPVADHYLMYGESEGAAPNPYFDPVWYLHHNSDLAASAVRPLLHFACFGAKEGRSPGPNFSTEEYLQANGDVRQFSEGALAHYLLYGKAEGRPLERPPPRSFQSVPFRDSTDRVLIVDSQYPTPDRDSGSIDALNLIHILQQLGYSVYFIATALFEDGNLAEPDAQAKLDLEELDVCVLDWRYGPKPIELVREIGRHFDLAVLSRVYCGGELYEVVRSSAPQARVIFNTVDLHSLRETREAEVRHDREALFRSYGIAEREYYLARASDATIVVSEEEARLLHRCAPGANVFTVPLIRDIPGPGRAYDVRHDIGFIGGFRHSPNVDAALFFLDEIWPLIRTELPDMRFLLVGADLPPELRRRTDPGLAIVGYVDDLAPVLDRMRLTVAPLRYGAGAKGKIVSSLSHGVPCVATPVAAEGMGIAGALLIATDAAAFAAQVVRLYTDRALWAELSESGLRHCRSQHSLAAGVTNIKRVLQSLSD